jgi:hypothetical protein
MKWFAILAAASLVAAGPLYAQEEPGASEHPAQDDAKLDKTLERAERDRAAAKPNDHAARVALEKWAGCIARRSQGEATRILTMDFTTPAYTRAQKMLAQDSGTCIRDNSSLRGDGLLFAGEMAEALLENGSVPIGTALAKAAGGPVTSGFSFTDKVAICVARSVPNDVAALFATARDSAAETSAINALATPMGMCATAAKARKPLSISPAGLRAMLATATFRSIHSAGSAS